MICSGILDAAVADLNQLLVGQLLQAEASLTGLMLPGTAVGEQAITGEGSLGEGWEEVIQVKNERKLSK